MILSDGRVFAYGNGEDPRGALWDPKKSTWTATAPSKRPRGESAASRLPDGRVLVTGGVHVPKGHYVMRSAEIYDPASNTWTDAGSTGAQRRGHTHTVLEGGRFLVTGGVGGGFAAPTRRIDAYDAASGKWSLHAELGVGRSFHTTLHLGGGRLLVVGGQDKEGPLKSHEVCDPGAKRCRVIPRPSARDRAAIALLTNGNVLITGGLDSRATSASEVIYDPGKGQFGPVAAMRSRRNGHTLTLLPDGRVLAVGGEKMAADTAEVYDPRAKAWAKAPAPTHGRHGHVTLRLKGDTLLLIGGTDAQGRPVLETERLKL
ncbi:MAG: hypothetical protein QF464_19515 [Myxococcota bacterium]|nr:hypothetical protein [Myxococcota bacterium]